MIEMNLIIAIIILSVDSQNAEGKSKTLRMDKSVVQKPSFYISGHR